MDCDMRRSLLAGAPPLSARRRFAYPRGGMDIERVNQLLYEEKEWPRLTRELTQYVHRRLRKSYALAEEVAQASIAQLFDPRYIRWDPDKETLKVHLMNVAKGRLKNLRKLRGQRQEQLTECDELSEMHFHRDDPDSMYLAKELRENAFASLRQALAHDEIGGAVLELLDDGIDQPIAQAEALKVDIVVVRNARRRIAAHAERLACEAEDADDVEMEADA
jgi:hypothetical protein